MKKTLINNNWAYQFHNKHEKHFIIESLKLTCPRIINYPNSSQESGYLIDTGNDTLTESTTIDKNIEIISFYLCLEMTFNKLSKKLKNVLS